MSTLKAIWSIDLFDTKSSFHKNVVGFLKSLGKGRTLEITAAYVVSPIQVNLPVTFPPQVLEEYQKSSEKLMEKVLKKHPLPGLKKSVVLAEPQPSFKLAADHLIREAKSQGAQMIVLGNHGRSGLKRLIYGSFAETLVLRSDVPCVLVSPKAKGSTAIKTILFGTDFSSASKRAFEKTLDFAKRLNATVVLFHKIPLRIDPIIQTALPMLGGGWASVEPLIAAEKDRVSEVSRDWLKVAQAKGLSIRFVEDNSNRSTSDSILAAAKKHKAQLISVASQSSSVQSTLLGSVTRELIRTTDLPLMIEHP